MIHRHAVLGEDPDATREIRERENNECRAGLRNPHLCTSTRARPELAATMSRAGDFLKSLRAQRPEFQSLADAFGESPTRPPPGPEAIQFAQKHLL